MSLSLGDRVMLARQAYLRAVAFARARSTPTSWARLLTAARNRVAAVREQERLAAQPGTHGRTARAPPGREARHAPSAPRPGAPTHLSQRATSTALASECERARALMAWSRALVEESRALCSAGRGPRDPCLPPLAALAHSAVERSGLGRRPASLRVASASVHGPTRWLEVAQVFERAHAVMERSCALVQEARALKYALVSLATLPASSSGR